MLKFVFINLLVVVCARSWVGTQCSFFIMGFLFGVLGLGFGQLSCLGFGLGVDYIRYSLVWLRI